MELGAGSLERVMMRAVSSLSTSLLLFSAVIAQAQPSQRIPRLCFLTFEPGSAESPPKRYAAFFEALRELGHVHGQSIFIDYKSGDDGGGRFPTLAAECLQRKSDILAVTTTPAAKAAKQATRTVPIVMAGLADPVRTGVVANLARPEGNVTGMSNMAIELAAKRLALLKEAVPTVSRVLVLTYLLDPIAALQVDALKEAAPSLGLTLLFHDIKTAEDFAGAFEGGMKDGADGLFVISASIFGTERAKVTELAARHRLPAIYPFSSLVFDADGLMAYHIDEPTLLRAAAVYVDRILKGAQPSDLPVQQPSIFKLSINLKAAKVLGLALPSTVISRADEVVE
jgi:putative ABC transport system substrate-binding protein